MRSLKPALVQFYSILSNIKGALYMEKYFANISYIKDLWEIPVKYNILKKAPEGFIRWYIKKFNPYIIQKTEMADIPGYDIKLAVKEEEIDLEESQELLCRTLEDLYKLNVSVINFNREFDWFNEFNFFMPKGDSAFCLKSREIMMKAVKYNEIDLKHAEIFIIGEENLDTRMVLEKIYSEVNFLTLILPQNQLEAFDKEIDSIFRETGLNVQVKEKPNVDEGDIIINTSSSASYDYSYKRGAVYIEMPKNPERFNNLIRKREDLFAVNNISVSIGNSVLSLKEYEMWLFLTDTDFRRRRGRTENKGRKKSVDAAAHRSEHIKHLYKNEQKLMSK